ncbi:MAG: Hsp20/alpha crystallin family protein [Candidatus Cloacimonas sp.]|nr:Hsp20/alpha crystallin family protein [Candidatus Cloacimonadota bacterium]
MPIKRKEEKGTINRSMRNILDDFLRNSYMCPTGDETRMMAMDVIEREDEYSLIANLPGINKKDIKVSLDGYDLIIEATRSKSKEEKDETLYRCERYQGNYRRVITLPDDSDHGNVLASYEDGVLTLKIPKAKKQEKLIKIK